MQKTIVLSISLVLFAFISEATINAQQATWIWYPGDYEIWLGNKVLNERTERGTFFPPFWKMDSHYVMVEFSKKLELITPETVLIKAEGKYNVKLDGRLLPGTPEEIVIPAGRHSLNIKVHNQSCVPAIFVRGETFQSDSSWNVTFEDKEWIDESGKASDSSSGTVYANAGCWHFNSPIDLPSQFRLATSPMPVFHEKQLNNGTLYDFGKETFGYLKFHGLKGDGILNIFYGESSDEALSVDYCETLDRLPVKNETPIEFTLPGSKAFRYVFIENDNSLSYDSVSMLYEYLPVEYKGSFRCSDQQINEIWDVSAYTLHLTTREFFIDGIKRDRWMWSGDAYQSYLMNYYLFFDPHSVARTTYALRGKDPVTSHINTIMDYTFYWFLGIYDYYQYTGDKELIVSLYPRMKSMMDFCLSRRNSEGMMQGLPGDWVFIDWSDFPMSKDGEVSFEQLMLCRSLETMALCAEIMNDNENKNEYTRLAAELKKKIMDVFWSDNQSAFVHNRYDGITSTQVTPYANIFAILFDYLDPEKTKALRENVLLNPEALKITTPYMRFYELEALCLLGEQNLVLNEIRDYWGGMLKLGATSFWEKYNPNEDYPRLLSMYGRPFGKSLCHSWGASPLYLLGKYFLGVKPVDPGYATYIIEPCLGDLKWMEGKVPTPEGKIDVYCSDAEIRVRSGTTGTGTLRFKSLSKPTCRTAEIIRVAENEYEIPIHKNQEITVKYKIAR